MKTSEGFVSLCLIEIFTGFAERYRGHIFVVTNIYLKESTNFLVKVNKEYYIFTYLKVYKSNLSSSLFIAFKFFRLSRCRL